MSDLVIILVILLIAALGWKSGAINILGSLGSWIVGYLAARSFSATLAVLVTEKFPSLMPDPSSSDTAQLISMFIDMDVMANRIVQILCFIVIFIVASFLVRKICSLISGMFSGTLLGMVNGAIGAGLGFCFSILLLGIAVEIVLPALSSMDWAVSTMQFFAKSQIMMGFVHDMLDLFVANIPAISMDMFK
ncbi:MAG: CvpA family protein [Firmicutes bacterium]|nr:CvpA family protein [Bacillota bacterium]